MIPSRGSRGSRGLGLRASYDYRVTAIGRARLARELERANPERKLAGRSEDDPEFIYQLERRAQTGSAARRASRARRQVYR